DEGCTSDLIESRSEGYLINLGDKGNGYHNAVKDILNDKKVAGMFKINAKKKIAVFNWKKVAEKYLRV
ncbi:MAG: hypothetical protein HQ490_07070, partial [Lutibacter sp.]|nr:hypothetical protein [Lutibacter sp.]